MTVKKVRSPAEVAWRQAHQDARWEIRSEYVMEFFSVPSCALPSQIKLVRDAFANPFPLGSQS